MQKILVVRNDKIGDFMLAWPSFAMLKQSMPQIELTVLVPSYTEKLAKLCPWIDKVIIDSKTKEGYKALVSQLKNERFSAAIALFSNTYNAKLLWKAKIPYRLAPATKLAQIFYNHRLRQHRSLSLKPEYEYNLDLIREFLHAHRISIVEPKPPYLCFAEKQVTAQKEKLTQALFLSTYKKWCFVHTGTGGSANNLCLAQYAQLIHALFEAEPQFVFILTAGPGEAPQAMALQKLIADVPSVLYDKNAGIDDFSLSIACADIFIAGSTGPLHIAAAIDIPTIGFFPSKRSATPLRWQPLNSKGNHLAFSPPSHRETQDDLSVIDMNQVMEKVRPWLVSHL